jgi:hypothetical protein
MELIEEPAVELLRAQRVAIGFAWLRLRRFGTE